MIVVLTIMKPKVNFVVNNMIRKIKENGSNNMEKQQIIRRYDKHVNQNKLCKSHIDFKTKI